MNTLIIFFQNFGIYGIILAGFSESTFLPFPMEAISIPIYLSNPKNAILYSLILITFSSLGSIFGYKLGEVLGLSFLKRFSSSKYIDKISLLYENNSFLTILSSAFTPIPYEIYVISAGIFKINFKKFLLASILSRFLRHFPQGILIFLFKDSIIKNLNIYVFGIGILFFSVMLINKYNKKRVKI